MAKKEYEAMLEQEIGSLGDDAQDTNPGLGKLKHKAAYGQKEDLEDDDRASLNAFFATPYRDNG